MYRAAHMDDVPAIAEIERLSFTDPWKASMIEKDLTQNPSARYTVAEVDGRVAGFASMWIVVDQGHIVDVAVHPSHRRRGIGRGLVSSMLAKSEAEGVTAHTLEVRSSNEAALALYRSFDFCIAGERKDYYQNPRENAWILWRISLCTEFGYSPYDEVPLRESEKHEEP